MAHHTNHLSPLLVLLFLLLAASPASAVPRTWQDNGDHINWSSANNWDPSVIPQPDDDVTIGNHPNAATDKTSIDQDFTIDSLAISGGASAITVGTVLTVKNDISIDDLGSALVLSGGSVTGSAALVNNSTLSGHGLLSVANLENNGVIKATGNATLIINTANAPDLDGTNEMGSLEALQGDLIIRDLPSDSVNGTIRVGGGRFIDFDTSFAQLNLSGTVDLDGSGSLEANAAELRGVPFLFLNGIVNVDQLAISHAIIAFGNQVTVNLPDTNDVLQVNNNADILSNSTITGLGRLRISGGTTRVSNNADVDATIENHSLMHLQAGIGTSDFNKATFDAFEQSDSGTLRLDIGGTGPDEFDILFVELNATLDGELEIILVNSFLPRSGDNFPIIQTLSGLAFGSFDTLTGDLPNLSGDLQWLIEYNPSFAGVNLRVLTPYTADFDGDGDVDGDDLTDPVDGWQARYGSDLNGGDFLNWQRQFGSGVPSLAVSRTVPEPATLWMLLLAAVVTSNRSQERGVVLNH